jgi:hypothetical protein
MPSQRVRRASNHLAEKLVYEQLFLPVESISLHVAASVVDANEAATAKPTKVNNTRVIVAL